MTAPALLTCIRGPSNLFERHIPLTAGYGARGPFGARLLLSLGASNTRIKYRYKHRRSLEIKTTEAPSRRDAMKSIRCFVSLGCILGAPE